MSQNIQFMGSPNPISLPLKPNEALVLYLHHTLHTAKNNNCIVYSNPSSLLQHIIPDLQPNDLLIHLMCKGLFPWLASQTASCVGSFPVTSLLGVRQFMIQEANFTRFQASQNRLLFTLPDKILSRQLDQPDLHSSKQQLVMTSELDHLANMLVHM